LFVVFGIAASVANGQTATPNPPQPASAFPPGDGQATFLRVCSTCHTPEIAANQRHDEAGWKAVVDLMADQGAVASDAEFAAITTYLTRTFPATEPEPQ
jgi:mono/diheme cytochrome c family protein